MTPLKKARTGKGWTLTDVVSRLSELGDNTDTGNLSRIERGKQRASASLAESLCKVFGGQVTEIHILYPERFEDSPVALPMPADKDRRTPRDPKQRRGRRKSDLSTEEAQELLQSAEKLSATLERVANA